MIKSNLGREGFISTYKLQPISKGSLGRNPKQKPRRRAAAWLATSSFLNYFPCAAQAHLPSKWCGLDPSMSIAAGLSDPGSSLAGLPSSSMVTLCLGSGQLKLR